jgi:hypothetical protein
MKTDLLQTWTYITSTHKVVLEALLGEPTLQVRGIGAEAEGCQIAVSIHGDTTAVAACAAGSADLHQLPKPA